MSVDGDLIQRHPIDSSFLFFVTGFLSLFSSWASKILLSGCVILLPIAVTLYVTWWLIRFFDGFFSPIHESLGTHVISDTPSRAWVRDFICVHISCGSNCVIGERSICVMGGRMVHQAHATCEAYLLCF